MSATENHEKKKLIDVVALALQRKSDSKYLITRRGPGQSGAGDWEFPGGKIEVGETETQALVREIKEELSIDLLESELHFVSENKHEYETKIVNLKLYKSVIAFSPDLVLSEHDLYEWLEKNQIPLQSLSPADIPFLKYL
jgi:8-oxo-dGTP diphosphatase